MPKKKIDYWPVVEEPAIPIHRRRTIEGRTELTMGMRGGDGTTDGLKFFFTYAFGGALVICFEDDPEGDDGSSGEYLVDLRDLLPVLAKMERKRRAAIGKGK